MSGRIRPASRPRRRSQHDRLRASAAADPAGELTISLRSVNHRGLDLHFHHAPEFAPFENAMRALLKQSIARGHVEIRALVDATAAQVTAAF